MSRQEVKTRRWLFIKRLIARYTDVPTQVVLNMDGWDGPTMVLTFDTTSTITLTSNKEPIVNIPVKNSSWALQASRLSCQRVVANQFRLLLAQAAYILMITVRSAVIST